MAVSKGGRKIAMPCVDGPWAGQTLWVWTRQTMYMNINGIVGRYVNGHWEEKKNEDSRESVAVAGPTGDRQDDNAVGTYGDVLNVWG